MERIDSEKGTVRDLPRRLWAPIPQGVWLGAIFWLLVILVVLAYFKPL